MSSRIEIAPLVEELLRGTKPGDAIELDAIGAAIGARLVSQDEIDAVMSAIEKEGRRVTAAEGGHGEEHLKAVLVTARSLRGELGRAPRASEIAERAGLSREQVEHALALAKIIQR